NAPDGIQLASLKLYASALLTARRVPSFALAKPSTRYQIMDQRILGPIGATNSIVAQVAIITALITNPEDASNVVALVVVAEHCRQKPEP
ncbi:hypothetical protein, partial [Chloroflexus sp.]|uniref:hypothetical protein n=1 Tax=Chloroflexus sp. TaxID=1904827 RepID=UPI00298F294C